MNIVEKKREQDKPYKESNVQHFVNEPYNGVKRIDLDTRPVAGSDAVFGSYDYFGSSHTASETNPSIGPYWRMQQLDSMGGFLEKVRAERDVKIKEKNKAIGVDQYRLLDKVQKLAFIFSNKAVNG